MTGLDFFVELFAMELEFWNWKNNLIPIQNFLMWFETSAIIHSIIHAFRPKINAKLALLFSSLSYYFLVYYIS
jgi:putative membrane protein